MKSLSIKNTSYAYYKDHLVIKGVNASFNNNSIHTLLGLNGSGKTTLIKLLAGLITPKEGSVSLDGKDLKDISFLERSKYIAYVGQDLTTVGDHYVSDYLSFGMMNQLSWYQAPSQKHLETVAKIAKRFYIYELLNKKMNELSGGQRQIVMICRAFIQDTDIIILDEPTSALDFKNQSLVLKILKEIVEKENKTIILSTHNPNHALYLNSEVVLIHEGRIIDKGPAKELICVEKLKVVYGNAVDYSDNLAYKEVSII